MVHALMPWKTVGADVSALVLTHAFAACTIKHCARNIEDHILVACEPF